MLGACVRSVLVLSSLGMNWALKLRPSHFNSFYVAWLNVSCSMPGSVKLEAPCQRSRVHWLRTRMPWRDYNFFERRDLAGGAGFLSFQSLLGRGVIVGLQAARCFSVVKGELEVDCVCLLYFTPHNSQNFRLPAF